MDAVALVVAAGRGERLGGARPKQYLPLDRQPMIRHSLATFARHPRIDAVRAVIHPDDRALYDAAASGLDLLAPVDGATDRQGSCRNGLESLAELAPRRVLIHDAARPFVDAGAIDRVLDALASAPAAIAALPVNDTIKRATADGRVAATVDRSLLRRAQTPQGFDYALILAAHRAAAGQALTDDAAVAEAAGMAVALVAGSEANVKITTEDDLRRVAQLTSRGGWRARRHWFRRASVRAGRRGRAVRRADPARSGGCRSLGRRRRAACPDRCHSGRVGRRRYRRSLPVQRCPLAWRRLGPVSAACRGTVARGRWPDLPRRRDAHLRAAEAWRPTAPPW